MSITNEDRYNLRCEGTRSSGAKGGCHAHGAAAIRRLGRRHHQA